VNSHEHAEPLSKGDDTESSECAPRHIAEGRAVNPFHLMLLAPSRYLRKVNA